MEIIINGELNEDYYNQLKKRVKQQVKEIKVKYNLNDFESIDKRDLRRCNYEIANYESKSIMSQRELPLFLPTVTVLNIAYKRAIIDIINTYLYDDRPIYIGYSGGKDSSVVVDLMLKALIRLKNKNKATSKTVHIFTSDTLVEMPHVLRMMNTNLDALEAFIKKNNLPVIVHRIHPVYKNRYFAQIIGVGIPLPRQNNRWCTDKMKILPTAKAMNKIIGFDTKKRIIKEDKKGEYFIDRYLEKVYLGDCSLDENRNLADKNNNKYEISLVKKKNKQVKQVVCANGFISITGSRRDESSSRKKRLDSSTQEGSFLKVNQTYRFSNNFAPIENWNTKSVWNYLFQYSLDWLDDLELWNLYSDASGKGAECAFIGDGKKEVVEEGKVGCAKSRFGCWACTMFDTDKSLDGLYKAHGGEYKYYIAFREYMMNYQYLFSKKTSWSLHRDVYGHKDQTKNYYNKDMDIFNPRFGMTRPSGYRLSVRIKLLSKLLRTEVLVKEELISVEELIFIQYRWLIEGDTGLLCLKAVAKYRKTPIMLTDYLGIDEEMDNWINTITKVQKKKIHPSKATTRSKMSLLVFRRFKVQSFLNKEKLDKMYFPTIDEEKSIRDEWETDIVKKENISDLIKSKKLEVPTIDTLFGKNQVDRTKLPDGLYKLILESKINKEALIMSLSGEV